MTDVQRSQPDNIRHSLEFYEPIHPDLPPVAVVTVGGDSFIISHDGGKVGTIKTDVLTLWSALLDRFPQFESEYELAFSL